MSIRENEAPAIYTPGCYICEMTIKMSETGRIVSYIRCTHQVSVEQTY